MMETYQIPKIFFDRYAFELSSDAFCLLINFYKFYLDRKEDGKRVEIQHKDFRKHILKYNNNEQSLKELNDFNLVVFYQPQNLYEINLTEINRASETDHKERFRIIVKGKKIKRKRGTQEKIDERIHNLIEKNVSRYSSSLQEKLKLTINGIIRYKLTTDKKIELVDVSDLLAFFRTEDNDDIIEMTCDAFNLSKKFSKVGVGYLNGILKNKKEEYKKKQENKKFKLTSLNRYKKELEDEDKILGTKIALNDLEGSYKIAYQAYLRQQELKELKRLYEIGIENLKQQNKENLIFKNYDWLKND